MNGNKAKDKVISVDCGTMFFQTATQGEDNKLVIKTTRNAFVEVADIDDIEETLKQNGWQYVKDGEHYYVIGEDSLRVAKMFPGQVELRRPMQEGVLNKEEDKKMLVMAELIESSIGKATGKNDIVCTCISSEAVDDSTTSTFHKARLEAMFSRLGYNVVIIEEGLAVVYSENPKATEKGGKTFNFSGIGISVGAGKINCVLAYKGMPVIGISSKNSGDWIDKTVSSETGRPIAQVTSVKENKLDLTKDNYDDEVLFALTACYKAMIANVIKKFSNKFVEVKSEFDAPINIVIAGGTSMPKGFSKIFEEIVRGIELPFEIGTITKSPDPRNSVVKGCLRRAIIAHRKLVGESPIKENVTESTE